MTIATELPPVDATHLRATFSSARSAAQAGGLPFAATLVDASGSHVMTATNGVLASGNPTAHAEMLVLERASATISRSALSHMTMFAAAEPCAMCAAAIVWSGVGRVVYGLSAANVRDADPLPPGMAEPGIQGRAVLDATLNGPVVIGPALEAEAMAALFPGG